MNDNRDKSTGIEIHLPAYFLVNEEWFDFFRFLPDFELVEVCDRRITRRERRRIAVQMADCESFIHATEYCFQTLADE